MPCQRSEMHQNLPVWQSGDVKSCSKLTILIVNKFVNRHNMSELSFCFG